ncbi:MAG: rhomboid family intramembrane serine protease [Pseudomonadota bacterium]
MNDNTAEHPGPPAPPIYVWVLAAIIAGIEILFQLADAGILPWPDLRWHGYLLLAFFDPLFEAWLNGEKVPMIAWTGTISHVFAHGGAIHMALNTAAFLALGGMVANVLGPARFAILFLATALGGVLTFAAITDFRGPMVGVSGVLFGLIGALKRWEWRYIQIAGAPATQFWRTIIVLIVINVLLGFYFTMGGGLAWEAHLGGFIAGFLVAGPLAPRLAGPSPI